MRKQASCLEKEIMQGTMPGARRRGRPRTAWMDNIKTWTGLSVEESIRMTEDRDKWRKYVHGVANPRIEDGERTEQNSVATHLRCSGVVITKLRKVHCLRLLPGCDLNPEPSAPESRTLTLGYRATESIARMERTSYYLVFSVQRRNSHPGSPGAPGGPPRAGGPRPGQGKN